MSLATDAPREADDLARAVALREAGRFAEARALLEAALAVDPASLPARLQLGLALLLGGDHRAAAPHFERVLAAAPDDRLATLNLGNALLGQGRVEEAEVLYRRAVARDPADSIAWNNLGHALERGGRLEEAAELYERALLLDPTSGLALANLRGALGRLDRPERLLGRIEEAARAPGAVDARLALSDLWRDAGRADAAADVAAALVADRPDLSQAHLHLGLARQAQGRLEEAEAALARAAALDPGSAAALACLAGARLELAKVPDAVQGWTRALALAPAFDTAASNRLLSMNYESRHAAADLADEHRRWAAALRARLGPPVAGHPVDRDPARRLRVGYVSADLRAHPVAAFLEPLLAAHDPAQVELVAYDCWHGPPDEVTTRLRALVPTWRRVHAHDDEALAALVRADAIDVLVDLAGHTGGSRLGLFARRAAPVQVTYLGYANTTGLETFDARLTDGWADPPGRAERLHSEPLARLPRPFLAWQPPAGAPDPDPLPPGEQVTFGCFNNAAKVVDPACIALWARLLDAVPGARLLLKAHQLAHPTARARVEGLFAAHGVAGDRLELTGRLGFEEHLRLHRRVAVMLDPTPYAGTTTTCEALWMGCPVVTLAGDRHAARVGVSLLAAVGLDELVATTPGEYLAIAAGLARDPARLERLRRGLRERVARSPLRDGPGLARAVEAVYRDRWRRACERAAARTG